MIMNINRLLALIAFVAAIFAANARQWEPLPAELDGTMMPYDFSKSYVAIPDSLTVFHAEYVARHGARYLSSAKKAEGLLSTLEYYRKKGLLTPLGREFLTFLNKIIKDSDGKWGLLSDIGKEEERSLAEEMAKSFPGIKETRTEAIATYVPRVVESMDIFTYSLARQSPDIEISSSSGKQYSDLLRFFDTWSPYAQWLKNGEMHDGWSEPLESFEEEHLPTAPAKRLITAVADTRELQKISMQMYGVLQSLRATGMGVPTTRWMSEEEYRSCWECANLNHYLKRSLSSLSTLPVRGAIPLLVNIIQCADASMAMGEGAGANLRFGHAETLLPLTALMGLPGCVALPPDYTRLSAEWKDYEISPLGANIRILFARTNEGRTYAAVWLNSREVVAWTPWTTLRSEWLVRAGSL